MRTKLIHEDAQRTFAVILDTGDEVTASLNAFAREQGITAAQVSAIGAFERCTLGYFDWQQKDYRRIPVAEQVEVVALLGDIGEDEPASRRSTSTSCSADRTAPRWAVTCSTRASARRSRSWSPNHRPISAAVTTGRPG